MCPRIISGPVGSSQCIFPTHQILLNKVSKDTRGLSLVASRSGPALNPCQHCCERECVLGLTGLLPVNKENLEVFNFSF